MTADAPVIALSESECLSLLRTAQIGRLALAVGGELDIFPINFVLDEEGRVVFRTAPGTKLAELVIHPDVVFETDHVEDDELWSVIVKGRAERLETRADIAAAEALPLRPWVPTVKEHFIRIQPSWITGRRFTRGPEPELDPAGTAA